MKINKNWAIKYAYPVFFIGLFIGIGDFLIGKYKYIGFIIMLFSFYLMYLSRDNKQLVDFKLLKFKYINIDSCIKWNPFTNNV